MVSGRRPFRKHEDRTMPLAATVTLVTLVSLVTHTHAHGAMTFPKPRNALDGTLAPWTDWQYPCTANHTDCKISFCTAGKDCQGACPVPAKSGLEGHLNASNGQSCYWFSNGCTVGCACPSQPDSLCCASVRGTDLISIELIHARPFCAFCALQASSVTAPTTTGATATSSSST